MGKADFNPQLLGVFFEWFTHGEELILACISLKRLSGMQRMPGRANDESFANQAKIPISNSKKSKQNYYKPTIWAVVRL